MKKYKVYECNEAVTPNGKPLKKLVLQGDGDTYPMKNVTMWGNHSLFDEIKVGDERELTIEVKDSTTPNPHKAGTFYKNRTVLENTNDNGSVAPDGDFLTKRLALLEKRVSELEGDITLEAQDSPAYTEDDIKPEDVPF